MKCKFHKCENEARENSYKGHIPLYCSKSCKTKDAVNAHRQRRKQLFVDYKGGKCQCCGYNKTIAALQFHHLDPTQKDFELSRAVTVAFEVAKPELDKCILVCANCHVEIHQGLILI